MKSPGSNDTNTYNLYICLFTGIFLDICGSLTKNKDRKPTEIEVESSPVEKSVEKKWHPWTSVHNHTKYSMSRMMKNRMTDQL